MELITFSISFLSKAQLCLDNRVDATFATQLVILNLPVWRVGAADGWGEAGANGAERFKRP
jgi:hypothetical protein